MPAAGRARGIRIILDHITRAGRAGLPYVYRGYWIDGCDRMACKRQYQPVEALLAGVWRDLV